MYKFEYTITEQEYMDFNEYHLTHSSLGKRNLMWIRCQGILISVIAIILFVIAGADKDLIISEALFFVLFSAVWFALGKRTAMKNTEKTIRKLEKKGESFYSQKGTLIFDNGHITDRSLSLAKEIKVSYSSVEQLCIGTTALYIYFSPAMAYIVPFRTLHANCNIAEFKEFIENKTELKFK